MHAVRDYDIVRHNPSVIKCCKDCVYRTLVRNVTIEGLDYGLAFVCIKDTFKVIPDIEEIPYWCPADVERIYKDGEPE